jgi:hypothetical protein
VGGRVWPQINNRILHGPRNNINVLQYGSFEVVEKVGDNSYKLNICPYMYIYSLMNVENKKFYEPSILNHEEE